MRWSFNAFSIFFFFFFSFFCYLLFEMQMRRAVFRCKAKCVCVCVYMQLHIMRMFNRSLFKTVHWILWGYTHSLFSVRFTKWVWLANESSVWTSCQFDVHERCVSLDFRDGKRHYPSLNTESIKQKINVISSLPTSRLIMIWKLEVVKKRGATFNSNKVEWSKDASQGSFSLFTSFSRRSSNRKFRFRTYHIQPNSIPFRKIGSHWSTHSEERERHHLLQSHEVIVGYWMMQK